MKLINAVVLEGLHDPDSRMVEELCKVNAEVARRLEKGLQGLLISSAQFDQLANNNQLCYQSDPTPGRKAWQQIGEVDAPPMKTIVFANVPWVKFFVFDEKLGEPYNFEKVTAAIEPVTTGEMGRGLYLLVS